MITWNHSLDAAMFHRLVWVVRTRLDDATVVVAVAAAAVRVAVPVAVDFAFASLAIAAFVVFVVWYNILPCEWVVCSTWNERVNSVEKEFLAS